MQKEGKKNRCDFTLIFKKTILLLGFVFLLISSICGESKSNKYNYLLNNKLKYEIVTSTACHTCPEHQIVYRVILDISNEQYEIIKQIPKEIWMQLLKDNKTDWAANLVLYVLKREDDASIIAGYEPAVWRMFQKKEDILYWNTKLK